jgi:hypothetical protein
MEVAIQEIPVEVVPVEVVPVEVVPVEVPKENKYNKSFDNLIRFYKEFIKMETKQMWVKDKKTGEDIKEDLPTGRLLYKIQKNSKLTFCVAASTLPMPLYTSDMKVEMSSLTDILSKNLETLDFYEYPKSSDQVQAQAQKHMINYVKSTKYYKNGKFYIPDNVKQEFIENGEVNFDIFVMKRRIFISGTLVDVYIQDDIWNKITLLNNKIVDPKIFYFCTYNDEKNCFALCVKLGLVCITPKNNNLAYLRVEDTVSHSLFVNQLSLCNVKSQKIKDPQKNEFSVITFNPNDLIESEQYDVEKYKLGNENCLRITYYFK